jgi:hypothetical protein
MSIIPRPDVMVNHGVEPETGAHSTTIEVRRDDKSRAWSGTGPSSHASTAEAVKKMLDDPITAEYVKESR